jgi:hypothetical protein
LVIKALLDVIYAGFREVNINWESNGFITVVIFFEFEN